MLFVDQARIKLKAGNGGDGAVAFHREKFVSAGGPDGGDGGKGGDIIFQVDDSFTTLLDFRYKKKYVAKDGEHGGFNCCAGKSAPDLIIRVPRGTLIRDAETGRLLADMSTDEPKIIAHGGKGGAGNMHFATPTRQAPNFAKPGKPGESLEVILELKLLADVGLVGYPNVGKSTLISVVSAAKPKIANYPFTTLTPVLGMVQVDMDTSFVMADIPGLIEGASEGVGLGHDFLRHVERCRLIVHVVDISGSEARDPIQDYETICHELRSFSEDLADRPQIVVGNKSDLATPEQIETFRNYIVEEKHMPFYLISAITHQGTQELVNAIAEKLQTLPPVKQFEPDPEPEVDRNAHDFTIEVEDGVYYVEAEWLDGILRTVNMDDYSTLQYFERVLRSNGIIDALEARGIQEGDTVDVEGYIFEYVP